MLKILLFATCFCYSYATVCYFIPPEKWTCIPPSKLSKYVNIAFVGKSKSSFHPSINLAEEQTEATLEEYIKAIKRLYINEKNTSIREIGSIKNRISSDNILLEISKNSPFGEIKQLQYITKKDGYVYILTASVLKKELLPFKDEFFKMFQSLKLTDNLAMEASEIGLAADLEKGLRDVKQKKISIQNFEKLIEKNYKPLGNHWKMLILKQAYESFSQN